MPIYLYRLKLGFLLGHRFVMIEHVGRKSGKTRQTVLEVVWIHERQVYVAAAWGVASDWYQNIVQHPRVTVRIASQKYEANAVVVDVPTAHSILAGYAERHPKAFRSLSRFMLEDPGPTSAMNVDQLTEVVPIVRLTRGV
jgi:deazaflavin-dependent oxidoreductase (nitroreductase family)